RTRWIPLLAILLFVAACGQKPTSLPENSFQTAELAAKDTTAAESAEAPSPFFRSQILPANRISPYDPIIKKYSRRYGFDWRLIAAQIFVESRFNPRALSHRGAVGLMQILPSTARHLGKDPSLLLKPEINIALGTLYDRRLYNLWEDESGIHRIAFMLASYNAGHRKVLRAQKRASQPNTWPGIRPHLPRQTQHYVKKIFAQYEYYKRRYF
ncbi:MAG TPA: lytic transglycosylase domain-containing protein, partial [Bacteroidetes bacterium]|nr:lytic transglycosylase domain-containing protein [Bacteroidota bacterium]